VAKINLRKLMKKDVIFKQQYCKKTDFYTKADSPENDIEGVH